MPDKEHRSIMPADGRLAGAASSSRRRGPAVSSAGKMSATRERHAPESIRPDLDGFEAMRIWQGHFASRGLPAVWAGLA
jgi:hypothetical protein